jgi:hypothetical protein
MDWLAGIEKSNAATAIALSASNPAILGILAQMMADHSDFNFDTLAALPGLVDFLMKKWTPGPHFFPVKAYMRDDQHFIELVQQIFNAKRSSLSRGSG